MVYGLYDNMARVGMRVVGKNRVKFEILSNLTIFPTTRNVQLHTCPRVIWENDIGLRFYGHLSIFVSVSPLYLFSHCLASPISLRFISS